MLAIADTLVPDAALLAGMLVITALVDWRLTIVTAGVLPLYALLARRRNRALQGAQQQARQRSGELSAATADLLARMPLAHVFGRAEDEAMQYHAASTRSAAAEVAALDAGARFGPAADLLPGLAMSAALVAGAIEVTAGRLTVGGLLVFLAYLSSLTGPVRALAQLSTTIIRGSASRDRLADLLAHPVLQPAAGARGPARAACQAGRPPRPRGRWAPGAGCWAIAQPESARARCTMFPGARAARPPGPRRAGRAAGRGSHPARLHLPGCSRAARGPGGGARLPRAPAPRCGRPRAARRRARTTAARLRSRARLACASMTGERSRTARAS